MNTKKNVQDLNKAPLHQRLQVIRLWYAASCPATVSLLFLPRVAIRRACEVRHVTAIRSRNSKEVQRDGRHAPWPFAQHAGSQTMRCRCCYCPASLASWICLLHAVITAVTKCSTT
ncbi:hypothetical protein M3J09_013218 [Ascochyta lentis]